MAKEEKKEEDVVLEKEAEEKKPVAKSKPAAEKIPLFKYFLSVDSAIHKYTRAYLEQQYKGILKSEEEWQKEMKPYMKEGA